jgi:hypothetical protein
MQFESGRRATYQVARRASQSAATTKMTPMILGRSFLLVGVTVYQQAKTEVVP